MGLTLLTGASSGIGRSLAKRMAIDGETVVAVARRDALLNSLVEEIREAGGHAIAMPADVTDAKAIREAIGRIEAELGPIDRLVANAGGGKRSSVDAFSAAEVERTLAVNVVGVANCVESVLPYMRERGAGHIVAVGSLAAYLGLPSAAAYSAAKAALHKMMDSLRIDLQPSGIDVTLIAPGFVRTKPHKKRKPFQVELGPATEVIYNAIRSRRRVCAFPLPLVMLSGLLRCLPAAISDRILWRAVGGSRRADQSGAEGR